MYIEVKNSVKPLDYSKSMKALEERVEQVFKEQNNELLWILEHKTVYTTGKNFNKADLIDKKLKIIKTNRCGKITLHSPGQKVIYFVLNLNKRRKNIRELVSKIENCIIEILSEFGIKSYADKKNIGIWVGKKEDAKKIAAIGIRVKKWIAYHGFSLNISNDLGKYKGIIPCGIKDKGVTSLKDLGVKNFSNINKIISDKFLNTFLQDNF